MENIPISDIISGPLVATSDAQTQLNAKATTGKAIAMAIVFG